MYQFNVVHVQVKHAIEGLKDVMHANVIADVEQQCHIHGNCNLHFQLNDIQSCLKCLRIQWKAKTKLYLLENIGNSHASDWFSIYVWWFWIKKYRMCIIMITEVLCEGFLLWQLQIYISFNQYTLNQNWCTENHKQCSTMDSRANSQSFLMHSISRFVDTSDLGTECTACISSITFFVQMSRCFAIWVHDL